jgi:hypothetical protein
MLADFVVQIAHWRVPCRCVSISEERGASNRAEPLRAAAARRLRRSRKFYGTEPYFLIAKLKESSDKRMAIL